MDTLDKVPKKFLGKSFQNFLSSVLHGALAKSIYSRNIDLY